LVDDMVVGAVNAGRTHRLSPLSWRPVRQGISTRRWTRRLKDNGSVSSSWLWPQSSGSTVTCCQRSLVSLINRTWSSATATTVYQPPNTSDTSPTSSAEVSLQLL